MRRCCTCRDYSSENGVFIVGGGALSSIGFLGRRPLVPVGAGVVMGWVGLGLRGRRHPLRSPSSLSMEGRRALGLRGRRHPQGPPPHIPTSPAPPGPQRLIQPPYPCF